MTSEELILKKLDKLEQSITDQVGTLNKDVISLRDRVKMQDAEIAIMKEEYRKQRSLTTELMDRIDRLADDPDNVLWKSKDGCRFGLDPKTVYSVMDALGCDHTVGLRILDRAHKLDVEDRHPYYSRQKVVRRQSDKKPVRAVVIFRW